MSGSQDRSQNYETALLNDHPDKRKYLPYYEQAYNHTRKAAEKGFMEDYEQGEVVNSSWCGRCLCGRRGGKKRTKKRRKHIKRKKTKKKIKKITKKTKKRTKKTKKRTKKKTKRKK